MPCDAIWHQVMKLQLRENMQKKSQEECHYNSTMNDSTTRWMTSRFCTSTKGHTLVLYYYPDVLFSSWCCVILFVKTRLWKKGITRINSNSSHSSTGCINNLWSHHASISNRLCGYAERKVSIIIKKWVQSTVQLIRERKKIEKEEKSHLNKHHVKHWETQESRVMMCSNKLAKE